MPAWAQFLADCVGVDLMSVDLENLLERLRKREADAFERWLFSNSPLDKAELDQARILRVQLEQRLGIERNS